MIRQGSRELQNRYDRTVRILIAVFIEELTKNGFWHFKTNYNFWKFRFRVSKAAEKYYVQHKGLFVRCKL